MRTLDELFPKPAIPLEHRDPYTLLIAVILSAQCTDARVNEVTPNLFAKADTAAKMTHLTVHEIRKTIQSCGLAPTKAKNIRKTSEILEKKYGGNVPESLEELEKLPGVGHKTAQVVVSQAFGQPAFAVDTHVHRLAYRWGLSTGKNVLQTEKDLKRTFPKDRWNDLHKQIIYFGRQYCPARKHNPNECVLCSVVGRKSLFRKSSSA
tara:strand:+ start:724 stop:1344 length:621 start_codon:yes stop_codon:yes gene_type:complete